MQKQEARTLPFLLHAFLHGCMIGTAVMEGFVFGNHKNDNI